MERAARARLGSASPPECRVFGQMNALDLVKATVVCGASAFLVYSFPVIGQVVIIAGLSVVWLSYAFKTVKERGRR